MEWFEALILGLIQGLTEYLPVSSSGHLAIGSALFGIQGEENLAFTVVVHVATVFSTMGLPHLGTGPACQARQRGDTLCNQYPDIYGAYRHCGCVL